MQRRYRFARIERVVHFQLFAQSVPVATRNIEAGARVYDIWAVNEDAEYHERF